MKLLLASPRLSRDHSNMQWKCSPELSSPFETRPDRNEASEHLWLFLDNSSAVITIRLQKLAAKLTELGAPTPTWSWILDFLMDRALVVRIGKVVSPELTVSLHWTQQGCCLSLQHFSWTLMTGSPNNIITESADDTTVLGLMVSSEEGTSPHTQDHHWQWGHHLKKERKNCELLKESPETSATHHQQHCGGVDRLSQAPGSADHRRPRRRKNNQNSEVRPAELYFLWCLKKAGLKHQTPSQTYRGLVESIFTSRPTPLFGNTTTRRRCYECSSTQQEIYIKKYEY